MSAISPMRTPERRLLSFLGDGAPPERKPEGGAMTRGAVPAAFRTAGACAGQGSPSSHSVMLVTEQLVPSSRIVDVSVHAATKYLSGHSDVVMGAIICAEHAWSHVRRTHRHLGQCTSLANGWRLAIGKFRGQIPARTRGMLGSFATSGQYARVVRDKFIGYLAQKVGV